MQRAFVICLVVAAVLTVGVESVGARQATPSAGAEECTVEPYDLTTVLEPTAGTPGAMATPEPTPAERPSGEPADEEVVAGVTETILQFVGCFNLGYDFRILFLFTPEYLRQFIAANAGPVTAEGIEQINELAGSEQPAAPRGESVRTVLHSIEDVEVLEDGRVVATVIGDDLSEPDGPSPVYFIFEEVDGRYLIDGLIDPEPDATPVADGTPAA